MSKDWPSGDKVEYFSLHWRRSITGRAFVDEIESLGLDRKVEFRHIFSFYNLFSANYWPYGLLGTDIKAT